VNEGFLVIFGETAIFPVSSTFRLDLVGFSLELAEAGFLAPLDTYEGDFCLNRPVGFSVLVLDWDGNVERLKRDRRWCKGWLSLSCEDCDSPVGPSSEGDIFLVLCGGAAACMALSSDNLDE